MALRDVVKKNAEGVVNRFENKFKEIRIEGIQHRHTTLN